MGPPAVPIELTRASDFLSRYLSTHASASQLAVFRSSLEQLLLGRFENHWYPGEPVRGNAYRAICSFDDASDCASIQRSDAVSCFPRDFVLWIDPGCVSYRVGSTGSIFTVFISARGTADLLRRQGHPGEKVRDVKALGTTGVLPRDGSERSPAARKAAKVSSRVMKPPRVAPLTPAQGAPRQALVHTLPARPVTSDRRPTPASSQTRTKWQSKVTETTGAQVPAQGSFAAAYVPPRFRYSQSPSPEPMSDSSTTLSGATSDTESGMASAEDDDLTHSEGTARSVSPVKPIVDVRSAVKADVSSDVENNEKGFDSLVVVGA
ncbi:hypothetical protein M427DRAFT_68608 [Gonapodya prolifera JEL478]|uniref:Anti-proliferative protein domain-containing protein n=1 Tax=Gonapodya prolifera (strain JEL478) TaxID=1344416 RepID=A0A139AK99_GONPJ|nr:hypothetical protein M427DRAFT_68608 [Gonapodya prolifera JEL478]|eukprot:KXS17196.1 hypothetical protein M427DRAFT_68608 [Gonapodya prolifera JEL478]